MVGISDENETDKLIMKRLGSNSADMREMKIKDVFFARLKLLIVMSMAYLKDYPLGEFRMQAVIRNARHVAKDTVDWGGRIKNFRTESWGEMNFDHVFFQRVKLLTVMAKAFAEGHPMGHVRRTALKDNCSQISKAITYKTNVKGMNFLKVA